MQRTIILILLTTLAAPTAASQFNILSNPETQFPPGCLIGDVVDEAAPTAGIQLLVDTTIDVPILDPISGGTITGSMGVKVWRNECSNSNYSAVMVRLVRDDSITSPYVPRVRVTAEGTSTEHIAHLVRNPEVTEYGATGNVLADSRTYILQVERDTPFGDTTFTPAEYNGDFEMEFSWTTFGHGNSYDFTDVVQSYAPPFDDPQFDDQPFNGRYSGQWTLSGKPNQGLVIQKAERDDGTRYIFVIMFTYLNGEATWVTGNTLPDSSTPSTIDVEMFEVDGGDFFTNPPGSYDESDIDMSSIGTLSLTPGDCGTLEADYDFSAGGFGMGSLTFERFIDLAGYTCNNLD